MQLLKRLLVIVSVFAMVHSRQFIYKFGSGSAKGRLVEMKSGIVDPRVVYRLVVPIDFPERIQGVVVTVYSRSEPLVMYKQKKVTIDLYPRKKAKKAFPKVDYSIAVYGRNEEKEPEY